MTRGSPGPLSPESERIVFAQSAADRDQDGLTNALDNCAELPNRNQADADGDGIGDLCDSCTAHA